MGEYEDRYPEAYGRGDEPEPVPGSPAAASPTPQPEREVVIRPAAPRTLRERLGFGSAGERAGTWQHEPAEASAEMPIPSAAVSTTEPLPTASSPVGTAALPVDPPVSTSYRGIGPRGYVRSAQRVLEDLCDRLTEDPFIDPSDVEVTVDGGEVTLTGTVDSVIALRQVQEIAEEVVGVRHVHNHLRLAGRQRNEPSAGDRVNAAMGSAPAR